MKDHLSPLHLRVQKNLKMIEDQMSPKAQNFFGLHDFRKRAGRHMWKKSDEKHLTEWVDWLERLEPEFYKNASEALDHARIVAERAIESLMTEYQALLERRKALEKLIKSLKEAEGYTKEIEVNGKKVKVNRDLEYYYKYLGAYKSPWLPIDDPVVLVAARAHFGDSLVLARAEKEGISSLLVSTLKEIESKKMAAWFVAIAEVGDKTTQERASIIGSNYWRY